MSGSGGAAGARPPILVLAIGNPSRGDDAVGPLLAARLTTALARATLENVVEVLCDQQLMVEHALDVQQRRAVLFIDASAAEPGRVAWEPVHAAARGLAITSHRCSPAQLMRLVVDTLHAPLPPAWLLSVGGHDFELGAPLQPATARALEDAWQRLVDELRARGVALRPDDDAPRTEPGHA